MSNGRPYWTRTYRGGLLSGLDRGEDILKYRYEALLMDEDREEWLRQKRVSVGLGGILEKMDKLEERVDQIEEELERIARRSAETRIRDSGPIPMGER